MISRSSILKMPLLSILLISIILALPVSSQAIVLSEIMFNPDGEEGSDEFIELFNENFTAVNLSGWTISDGEGTDTLANLEMGLTVGPRRYILIFDPDYFEDGSTTYDGLVPESALVITISGSTFGSRGLSNSTAETVSVRHANGNVVAEHTYDTNIAPGKSAEKILMSSDDTNANWGESLSINGTPGARNSITPPDLDLSIKRFEATPRYPGPQELFEISIVVENRGLSSAGDSLCLYELEYLQDSDGIPIAAWQTPILSMNDSAIFTHSMNMEEASSKFFKARLMIEDQVPENNNAVLSVGAVASLGSVVINEIMFQPNPGQSEWIELYNIGHLSALIEHWSFSDGTGLSDTSKRIEFPSIILDSSSYMVLAADSTIFEYFIPEESKVLVWNSSYPSLNNAGDSLVLFDAQGNIIDRVDYRANWGNGSSVLSLERVSALSESNDPLNWATSLDASGSSPGQENSRALPASSYEQNLMVIEPNPFSPNGDGRDDLVAIRYHLDEADSRLDIKIFDVRGRQVRFLCNNVSAGFRGEVLWDGKNDSGRELPTGMYVVYLEALGQGGNRIQSGRRVVAIARPS